MARRRTEKRRPQPGPLRDSSVDRRLWVFFPLLLVATLLAYQPAWHGGRLWDDDGHLTKVELQSADGLRRIWFDVGATQQYYPVVHSAFWMMHAAWGDDTLGYHIANIVLHAASAFLILCILARLRVPAPAFAAFLFALHPVQVESVAWMTELKNCLSGVLYLAAALVYLRFDEARDRRRYTIALVLFVLAVLAKSVTATLPAALLIVFWWQRGRIRWREDVAPLLPFFVVAIVGGSLTTWMERTQIGAQGTDFRFSFLERCLIAGRVVWFYLAKLVWPANLMFNYPRWTIDAAVWWQYLFPLMLAATLAALWMIRRRTRAPLAALLFFCVTVAPAMGFVDVYPFRFSFVADHFQYLACIGVFALAAAGAGLAAGRLRLAPAVAAVAMALIVAPLSALTFAYSRQYVDADTLYRETLARNPDSWLAHFNLAVDMSSAGRTDEAIREYRDTIRIKPDYVETYNNLGALLEGRGQFADAANQYRKALSLNQHLAFTHNNLGKVLVKLGRPDEAIAQLKQAIVIDASFAAAHANLGSAFAQTGRLPDAIAEYTATVRLDPTSWVYRANLGMLLTRAGKREEAIQQLQEAARLNPSEPALRAALTDAEQGAGQGPKGRGQDGSDRRAQPSIDRH